MAFSTHSELWGVVGGLGPRASAEFLKTIYEVAAADAEQGLPRVALLSDPSLPDRTESILSRDHARLLAALTRLCRQLIALEASRIVLCCMTIHYLLYLLPADVRSRIVSLLDVLFDAVLDRGTERHLLLCTTGSRQIGVFERHPRWASVRERIVMPDERDQRAVHDAIYEIKRNGVSSRHAVLVDALLATYGVASGIAGCTELHLLANRLAARAADDRPPLLDPLRLVATAYIANPAFTTLVQGRARS
jgi:aspartate racemase